MGAGGHARVLIDALQAGGTAVDCCLLDPDPARHGQSILGVPIVGGDDKLLFLRKDGYTHFVIGVGSTGDSSKRKFLFEHAIKHDLSPLTIIHPQAICAASAEIGAGSVLFAGSIVNPGAKIGENVIINTGAIVEHDCVIGQHSHIAPGACLAGEVWLGNGVHIGAGAVIRQGIKVGDGAVIGAGAVVVKDVLPGRVMVGIPARPLGKS